MANINSIEINQFRGIRQLTISNFSKINLIVGDNNSGKTMFLESVQLLFAKSQLRIGFIDSLKEEVVPELSRINSANKATVGTFFNVRDPRHAMRSFATYVSKIDWSKSESLNEMFLPFMDLGTTKELYM